MTLPMMSSVARLVAPVATSFAVLSTACARVMAVVVEYGNRDDHIHHDPLSEHWNWNWLTEVDP